MKPLVVYRDYLEIPLILQECILTVSGETAIMNVPIEDINGYLSGITNFYTIPSGEYDEDYQSAPVLEKTSNE